VTALDELAVGLLFINLLSINVLFSNSSIYLTQRGNNHGNGHLTRPRSYFYISQLVEIMLLF
jgi:hypothetical protein